MAYVYSTALKTAVDAATTQVAENTVLNTMLGSTRTIALLKNDVVFYQGTITGPIVLRRNYITSYGKINNVTVSNAADLKTGVCKLRMSGNGHFIEASMGLTIAAQLAANISSPVLYDFMMGRNPTANCAIGFSEVIRTKVATKTNGVGPAKPVVDADIPYKFEISSVVNGVEAVVGSLICDQQDESLLLADQEMAGQMGETLVFKSNQSIIFDKFEFGGKVIVGSAANSVSGTTPLYRFMTASKPVNQGWNSYPAAQDFNPATVYMHPPPFRARLYTQDNRVLKVWQGRDGTPVNDLSWAQDFFSTAGSQTNAPCRPFWHCAASLVYFNTWAKRSPLADKFLPGIVDNDACRPSSGKRVVSCNGTEPVADGYTNRNGLNHMYAMNQWPGNAVDYFDAEANKQDLPLDPFMQQMGSTSEHSFNELINGWDGREPGAKGGLEYQTGPGGVRFDRNVFSSLLSIYQTYPTGSRLKGNVPWIEMVKAQAEAYFNIPMFIYRDVKNFTGIPDDEIIASRWNDTRSYYGGDFNKGAAYTVDRRSVPNATYSYDSNLRDVNGHLFYNGRCADYLHGYQNPGMFALLFNDPIFVIVAKHRFVEACLGQLGDRSFPQNDWQPDSGWGTRETAWRLVQRTMAWKLASGGFAGFLREDIEDHMRRGLEGIYDNYYVPTRLNPSLSDIKLLVRKNLGVQINNAESEGQIWNLVGGGLNFYIGDALILLRQTGLWKILSDKNYKCRLALRMIIEDLDKAAFDWILDTPGNFETYGGTGYYPIVFKGFGNVPTVADVPASWADWMIKTYPHIFGSTTGSPPSDLPGYASPTMDDGWLDKRPGVNWIRDGAGNFRERNAVMHIRGAWGRNRKTFFTNDEIPYGRLDEGTDKYDDYYAEVTENLPTAANFTRSAADWVYLTPANGKRKAPSVLEPIQ